MREATTEQSGDGLSVANEQRTRCEVWTRVMGYHRPVSHFNVGKKAEHYSRKHFEECVADNSRFVESYPAIGQA